ncbi:hypothetical protein WH79_02675 [Streptococcus dysgalactiae subsp. equisimilis]|nr:hypothetical protein WH79_02675 [Streptococcus dysgalactiae subsp. equisimilis]
MRVRSSWSATPKIHYKGGAIMATTSFTKNFNLSKAQSDSFVKRMTQNAPVILSKGFESKYEHPNAHLEKLRKVFKK